MDRAALPQAKRVKDSDSARRDRISKYDSEMLVLRNSIATPEMQSYGLTRMEVTEYGATLSVYATSVGYESDGGYVTNTIHGAKMTLVGS